LNNNEKTKKVCVLMSTYNGSKYIDEQIDSLFKNKDVSLTLFVRDDGSTDSTVDHILRYREKYPEKVYLTRGSNVGFMKSFMGLLDHAPKDFDYYAFCDQDDVWMPDKLIKAIEKIESVSGCATYCSSETYVDEHLNKIDGIYSNLDELPTGWFKAQWSLSVSLVGLGCTFVWNKAMQDEINKVRISGLKFGHDQFISILAPLVGKLYRDGESHILYRQHSNNTGEKRYKNKYSISRILKRIFSREHDNDNLKIRKFIYAHYDNVPEKNRRLLKYSIDYRTNVISMFKMLKVNYAKGLNKKEEQKFFIQTLLHKL
jgi:glycosyltransferase involved in cell wall biosynthesis